MSLRQDMDKYQYHSNTIILHSSAGYCINVHLHQRHTITGFLGNSLPANITQISPEPRSYNVTAPTEATYWKSRRKIKALGYTSAPSTILIPRPSNVKKCSALCPRIPNAHEAMPYVMFFLISGGLCTCTCIALHFYCYFIGLLQVYYIFYKF